jgi:VWFA-related protein
MRRTMTFVLAAFAIGFTDRMADRAGAAALAEQTRTVYVSATDSKGAPVTDLTAADLAVKEGGKERQIVSVTAATAPMQVEILVDDGGTGGFQAAVAQFLQATLERGEFSISLLSPQPAMIVDYTRDPAALKQALGRLIFRGKIAPDNTQVPAAVATSATKLRARRAQRPVILVLTVSGESRDVDNPDAVLDSLKNSGAMLNVIITTGTPSGMVLGDGPRQSGGRVEQIGGSSGIGPAIDKIVEHLTSQYVVSYTLPDGVKPNERVSVTTSRKGVSLRAPSRVPDK